MTLKKSRTQVFTQFLIEILRMPIKKLGFAIDFIHDGIEHGFPREVLVKCNTQIFDGFLGYDNLIIIVWYLKITNLVQFVLRPKRIHSLQFSQHEVTAYWKLTKILNQTSGYEK